MRQVDSALEPYLAAWRDESRRTPRSRPRALARAAMLDAALSPPMYRRIGAVLSAATSFRLRRGFSRRVSGLAAATLAMATLFLGWNAPAGSSLYGVRAARQGVQLLVPGAYLAALHLEFAAQSLADAHNGISTAASLADARSELDAARAELPADHTSALWVQWNADEVLLADEEAGLVRGPSPTNRALPPPLSRGGTASAAPAEQPPSSYAGGSATPTTEPPEASPSASTAPSGTAPASPGPHDN